MTETKAQKRIKNKNKKTAAVDAEVVEGAPAKKGPEPYGLKERVKQGFITEAEALEQLKNSPYANESIVGWLRRRM